MPLLYNEFELTIDDKNRFLVPSEVRKQLDPDRDGNAFFAIMGVNRHLWLYPEKYYEALATRDPGEMIPADEALAFDQMNFALASKFEWDSQGRIQLPAKVIRRHTLEKAVTLIGVRDHLEVWNTPEWEQRREELLARSLEVSMRAKEARRSL